jgi:2-oxoglutarate ferredoxin oxidoreductase subunit gamma
MLLKTVFSGFGGQGVLMMGYVLAVAGMQEDKHVTYLPSYGAEVRGGTANCTVVVSDGEIASPVASHPDYVVAMNFPSMIKYRNTVKPGGIMFLNSDLISEPLQRENVETVEIPANSLAREMGNDRALNMIMLGAVTSVTKVVSLDALAGALATVFGEKKKALVGINREALVKGSEYIAGRGR